MTLTLYSCEALPQASEICLHAAELVDGDRAKQHGPKRANWANIAGLWNAYLGARLCKRLSPLDCLLMMVLLKVARTRLGKHNADNYVDMTAYGAIAGEIASGDHYAEPRYAGGSQSK